MNVDASELKPCRPTAMMPRQMQRLPPSTQSKIRSTQILTSLPQVISELVQNSLDAGASHIDVGVDCEDWACWVRDDGCGIARDDFDALASGGQAARYSEPPIQCFTSRRADLVQARPRLTRLHLWMRFRHSALEVKVCVPIIVGTPKH